MTTHHVSLYHPKTDQPASTVLKQELITYHQTSPGLKVTKLKRPFSKGDHIDSYTSAPLLLTSCSEQEGLLWGRSQRKRVNWLALQNSRSSTALRR